MCTVCTLHYLASPVLRGPSNGALWQQTGPKLLGLQFIFRKKNGWLTVGPKTRLCPAGPGHAKIHTLVRYFKCPFFDSEAAQDGTPAISVQ